jgi:hypothetical protein
VHRFLRSFRIVPALAAILAGGLAAAQPATSGGPLPGPLPLFPHDNWWNLDVSAVAADSGETANFLAHYGASAHVHPDFGGDVAGGFPEIYGMVYVTVPGSQPLVPVAFDYADESDAGAPGRPAGYPIPPEAIAQPSTPGDPHWIEGGYPGNEDQGGDQHMLIVDRDHRILFETWQTRYAGGQWQAGSGAVFSLDSDARRPEGWTSADAAGLAILPGLVRYDEAYGSEPIRHAFRVTLSNSDGYVFPASHIAGSTAGALPFGARLRLKPGFSFPAGCVECQDPGVQRIAQAMKTYGLIFADNGSDMFISGTYDTRWNNDVLNPALATIHAGDFEVLPLGYQPAAAGCVPDAGTLCLNGGHFQVRAQWTDFQGNSGPGHVVPYGSDSSGMMWFFGPDNWEMLVKVLDGCGVNSHVWVFAALTTDIQYTIQAVDTLTGEIVTYTNPLGNPSPAITDTSAFTACP